MNQFDRRCKEHYVSLDELMICPVGKRPCPWRVVNVLTGEELFDSADDGISEPGEVPKTDFRWPAPLGGDARTIALGKDERGGE